MRRTAAAIGGYANLIMKVPGMRCGARLKSGEPTAKEATKARAHFSTLTPTCFPTIPVLGVLAGITPSRVGCFYSISSSIFINKAYTLIPKT
jgi:hypothetical protein